MDLETENKIAGILMKEAAELRRQAEKDGVHAYLHQQKARGRPNSRFLTATVLGVQQANRVVEVNEMWRVRQKEIELDEKIKGRSSEKRNCYRYCSDSSGSGHRESNSSAALGTWNKHEVDDHYSNDDGGLKDEEVEEFLHKRVKRGRGAVGSRMDETGPFLAEDSERKRAASCDVRVKEEWEHRVLGPEKPPSFKLLHKSSEDELDWDDQKKKPKKVQSDSKKHSKKHRKKDGDGNKRRKEKKSKHRRHS